MQKNLIKVLLEKATNNEFAYTMKETDSAIQALNGKIQFSNYNAFSKLTSQFILAMQTNRNTQDYTKKVAQCKDYLLNRWDGMIVNLKAKSKNLDSTQQQDAANQVLLILSQFKNFKKRSLEAIINIVNVANSMIAQLDKSTQNNSGITPWLPVLKTANNDLILAIKQRELFKTSINRGEVRQKRRQLHKLYTALCTEIENYSQYNPCDLINQLIATLNEIAIPLNAKLSQRGKNLS